MMHSARNAAVTAAVVLAMTGCGSNATIQEEPQIGGLDAGETSPIIVDAGVCRWPAGVTSSGDASSVGCWAKAAYNVCQVPNGGTVNAQDGTVRGPDGQLVADACHDVCSASEYALTCTGDTMMTSTIPSPDTSLGCTPIPGPTPSNVLFYCCACL